MSRSLKILLAAFCVACLAWFLLFEITYTLERPLCVDEHQYLAASTLVSLGKLPYRDFAFNQAPLMAFLYGLLFRLAPPGFLFARMLTLGFAIASVLILAATLWKGGDPLQRRPLSAALAWIERQFPKLLAFQKPDGTATGDHLDGNWLRTVMLYASMKARGTIVSPWRADLAWGASPAPDGLHLWIESQTPWQGRLLFDLPRHRVLLHLSKDYPRLNEMTEWFTVEPQASYAVRVSPLGETLTLTGEDLAAGLPLSVSPDAPVHVVVSPAEPPRPPGSDALLGPSDALSRPLHFSASEFTRRGGCLCGDVFSEGHAPSCPLFLRIPRFVPRLRVLVPSWQSLLLSPGVPHAQWP